MVDPWELLGLAPGTPWPHVRARWLALAKDLHPDRRADDDADLRRTLSGRLAEVNRAYQQLAAARDAASAVDPAPTPPHPEAATATFAIDDFRPVVFEAVVVASAAVGDITDSEEPFSLELFVEGSPGRRGGFCHVELAPEAGGSVISVDSDQVDVDAVCHALIAGLGAMGFAVTFSA